MANGRVSILGSIDRSMVYISLDFEIYSPYFHVGKIVHQFQKNTLKPFFYFGHNWRILSHIEMKIMDFST
jgi:hypothetical protein